MNLSKDMELRSPHDAFKRFMDILESGTWKCTATQTLDDGRIFDMLEKENGDKFPIVKCVGVLKVKPEKILDFFLNADLDARKEVTPNLSKYEIIKEFEDDIHLLHYTYRAPFPIRSRDFCLKRFLHRKGVDISGIELRGLDILLCGVSIVDEDLPPIKKYIRGEVIMSGYLLESISDEETRITSLIYVDPKGWIPNFVVAASKNGELTELTNLAKVIES